MRIGRQKSIMDRAHDYVESVAESVIPQLEAALETARDKAVPAITDARDRAVPLLQDAQDKAAPLLAEGRARAGETAAAGAALAAAKAAASRDFATAKVAELRGAPEPEPAGSKLKKLLLLGGLLAIGGAVFAKLRQKSSNANNWQSAYVPPPPPAPKAPPSPPGYKSADVPIAAPVSASAPVSGAQGDPLTDPFTDEDVATPTDATDDVGGGAPGEALSDSVETPHEVSTPDSPAEVIDVDDVPDQNKY